MRVLNKRKDPLPENSVYIGRPSKWGNPFKAGKDGTRSEVIAMYEQYIMQTPSLLNALHELEGKDLVCWCKPKACHGDVLLRMVKKNGYEDILEY